ncbi:MAG: cellulase family glycosylhydrolase [Candidatus Aminicenantes bacterium]|nr:cellulase family glycosylhydrolase [Candidatus Aminicenantes bacterium]
MVLFLLGLTVHCNKNSTSPQAMNRILFQDKEYFVFGTNLPWLDGQFDHDIGPNSQHPEWGVAYDREHLKAYFLDMKAMGAHFVRIWLWENAEGLLFDDNGRVSGVHEIMWENLDDLMALAEEFDLPVYWCLISGLAGIGEERLQRIAPVKDIFPWQNIGQLETLLNHTHKLSCKERLLSIQKNLGFIPSGIRSTPLANLMASAEARQAYIENALVPFISRYSGNPHIFAIDIMNEPEADVAGPRGNWSDEGIDWDSMRTFIAQCTAAVHSTDPSRLVSCGSGWHNEENVRDGYYRGLGLDFYDIHVYRDDGWLPSSSSLNLDKPCLIGEFGQRTDIWDDTLQNTADTQLMNNAWDLGYAGCLVWDYNYPGAVEVHTLLYPDGQWRPVCYSLKEFDLIHAQDTQGKPPGTSIAYFTFQPYPGFSPLQARFFRTDKRRTLFLGEDGDIITSEEEKDG